MSREIAVSRLADCLLQTSRFQDRETAISSLVVYYQLLWRLSTWYIVYFDLLVISSLTSQYLISLLLSYHKTII